MATPRKAGATPVIPPAQTTTLNDPYAGKSPQSPQAVSRFQQRMIELAQQRMAQQAAQQGSGTSEANSSGTGSHGTNGSITGSAEGDQLAQQYMQQVELFYANMANFGSGTRVEIDQSDDTPDPTLG